MFPLFLIALFAGKLSALACRILAPTRGSNLPGVVALKFDRNFLSHVRGVQPGKTIFITGTNGKSTATTMVVHALREAGLTVATNTEGANMMPGVATVLIRSTKITRGFTSDFLVLEIDERSLATISQQIPPGHLGVLNIQKDQVQRNGEPDYIYQKIKTVVDSLPEVKLYLNDDEPRSRSLGLPPNALTQGEPPSAGSTFSVTAWDEQSHHDQWEVTMPCPRCAAEIDFHTRTIAGMGEFLCHRCNFGSRQGSSTVIDTVDFLAQSFTCGGETYHLGYLAPYFLYNYAFCLCLCTQLGIDGATLVRALESFTNISGRMESFTHQGKTINYMRIKQENPETLQSALDTLARDSSPKVFVLGPAVIDDFIPHYSNTFYTFDCDFGPLVDSGLDRCICFGDTIAWDTANRLIYAGVPREKIDIIDSDHDQQILNAIAACEATNVYLITWIKKFQKLKEQAS
ncbi:MAG: MurT ligase domain-containing protein [Propionibacteriaceae bacterium]|jgi:UDP-N-acetylmuramyl tripeptide synthase|nr:MurT ligase domain-containing protein [Propionibacteriaceae bacterium]